MWPLSAWPPWWTGCCATEQARWDWPVEFLFASIVIIWLVINELLSILENVSAMGAPVPDFVQSLLQKLKGHTEHTMEGEEERND